MSNDAIFETRGYFAWQLVHAAAVSSWKTVSKTGECKGLVARAADHIFRLP